MKNIFIFFLLCLCLSCTKEEENYISTQSILKTFGGNEDDFGKTIIKNNNGDYSILGTTNSYGSGLEDIYLINIDSLGNQQWAKTLGGANEDHAVTIVQSDDGGFVIAATSKSFWNGFKDDVILIKTDNSGNQLWHERYGNLSLTCVSMNSTDDEGFIILANSQPSLPSENSQMWLFKTSENGSEEWGKKISDSWENDIGASVIQTNDGGYIVLCDNYTIGSNSYFLKLMKLDSNGNKTWQKSYNVGTNSVAKTVKKYNNGFVISGHTTNNLFLLNVDENGTEIWTNSYTESGQQLCASLQQTSDNGFVLVGSRNLDPFGSGDWDIILTKVSSNGTKIWSKTYGDNFDEIASSVIESDEGKFAVTGFKKSEAKNDWDILFLKSD